MKRASFAHCLLPQSIDRPLTYSIPEGMSSGVRPGVRVRVPLRHGSAVAVVVETGGECPQGVVAKPLLEVLDASPFFDEAMLKFLRWAADYYLAPAGMVLRAALPEPMRRSAGKRRARTAAPGSETPASVPEEPLSLTSAQSGALKEVVAAIDSSRFEAFLLHGVTSSGKTEVYLRAAARALELGRSAIILVPEIALSYQVVARFTERFPGMVTVLHSRLTGAERSSNLESLRKGPRIAIGARSAVFAPAVSPGLFVVDEEHEGAYKQEDAVPFYHARECALMRAKLSGCPVVLGSATPSLESAAQARAGRFRLLELPERIDATPLPLVEIVAMNREPAGTVIGARMAELLLETRARHEQSLLFLNRRGFSPAMLCASCGKPVRCASCSTSLVFHAAEGALKCHWCGSRIPVPGKCPACGVAALRPLGFGTERVEAEVRRLLPGATLVRMDQDTTRKRTAHRDLLEKFTGGDVLVGTQMVAKGLDFPRLTLVGVVLADVSLALPDFRAAERTFQLVTQVAGRAGRRDVRGRVVLQTFAPSHPALTAAAEHDYRRFYDAEAAQRKALRYPPFGRLARFRFTGASHGEVSEAARTTAAFLRRRLPPKCAVLGPAPAMPAVVARRHHWHLMLKGPDGEQLRELARAALDYAGNKSGACRVQISVDVNPLNVLS